MGFETLILGTLAAGTAVQAFGQVRAGRAAREAGELEAREEELTAAERARVFTRRGRLAAGEQRAGFARAGVRTTEGSPLLLALETADELERGLAEIRRGGEARASFARFRGREAGRAGTIGAVGTLLGGTANLLATREVFTRTGR